MDIFQNLNPRFCGFSSLIRIESVTKSLLVLLVFCFPKMRATLDNANPRSVAGKLAMLVLLGTMSASAQGEITVTRVSESAASEPGNSYSINASISADGRFVAFSSFATNLVPDDTNEELDVFVKNVGTGEIMRVSEDASGVQGNSQSGGGGAIISVSSDGRFVGFESYATNLVPGDTNSGSDIFVKNVETGEVLRASENAVGEQGNNESHSPSLSADGGFVAFESEASNLVSGDTNRSDVFVKNVGTGEIVRVSENAEGIQGNGNSGAFNFDTGNLGTNISISADGRMVAFPSSATNLVPNDTNDKLDVFVKHVGTGEIVRVSEDAAGMQGNDRSGDSGISISADGLLVAFSSFATNLLAGLLPGDTNETDAVFVKNLETGVIVRVSENASGEQGNSFSNSPSLSADGSFIAFQSSATNLVPDDSSTGDIFVKNAETGEIVRLGVGGHIPSISADGRLVAFESFANNLVPDDTNDFRDAFVADVTGVHALTTPGNLRFAVYSRTAAELFWDRPVGQAYLYRVYLNGVLEVETDGVSWWSDDFAPGSTTNVMVVAVDSNGAESSPAQVIIQTSGAHLSPVTGLRAAIYSATAAEIFWDRKPGIGHQYRIYADGVKVATTDGTSWFSNKFEAGSTTRMTVVAFDGPKESVQRNVIITTGGGKSEGPSSGVPAVTGLRATVYNDHFAEVFWDRPINQAYRYRVFFNGMFEVETDGVSWWSRDFAPGSITEVTVIAVDSQRAESLPAAVIVQTPGG